MITKPKKYTNKYVKNQLELLLFELQENEKIIYLGQLFTKKPYTSDVFSRWDLMGGEISHTIQTIRSILQTRAVAGAMDGTLNGNFVKFHLINNFNWKDKTEVENVLRVQEVKQINYVIPETIAGPDKPDVILDQPIEEKV